MTNKAIEETQTTQLPMSADTSKMLAEYAQEQGSGEESSIPWLSTKGKRFSIGDTKIGTSMDVVILATAYDNAYYDKPYDPDLTQPPACFAISLDGKDMSPDPSSPAQVTTRCEACHFNEYESAPNGKGKACKNGRRLLIASAEKGIPDLNDLAILRLPPTALKAFSCYVKAITMTINRPLWSIVTTLQIDEDSDWPKPIPVFKSVVDDTIMFEEILGSKGYYESLVTVPYLTEGYVPPNPEEEKATANRKSKMS